MRLSFEDPATPRQRLVEIDRHGDREERRTLEVSTEVVPYLTLARSAAVAPASAPTSAPEAQGVATTEAELVAQAEAEAQQTGDWPGLAQVCRILREVEYVSGARAGEYTREWAYALTALAPAQAGPARLLKYWRGHWQIENGLHWVRDVTLGEDTCQVRAGAAPANLAAVRNTVLGLIRRTGHLNVAQALRRYAMYPVEALALLGLTLPGTA